MTTLRDLASRPERDGILRRVKLIGHPEAVAWVAKTLSGSGLLVERFGERELPDPKVLSQWPVVWVAGPESFGRGPARVRSAFLDAGARTPPCLVVLPPGVEATEALIRSIPVDSFEVVRAPEDAPLLASRLERLLLLHRRRSQTEENAFKERLRLEARRNEILASIALAARDSLDLDEVLGAATALLGTRLSANSVEVWFVNEDRSACRVYLHWRAGDEAPSLVGYERPVPESEAFQSVIETLEPYVVSDRSDLDPLSVSASALEQLGAMSFLGVPIHREGETMGLLGLSWSERRAFPQDEVVFFGRVADQLALAIRAARLYGNLQKQVDALALEQKRREQADRDRSRLTAMLVHDMKSPLSALTAALELTREKEKKGGDLRIAKMLEGSLASARGLQGLIQDALLVYRSEDAPEIEKRPVSPSEALALTLEEARWLARAKKIDLQVDVPASLPRVPLDAGMFCRAAANLIGNAVKYSPHGSLVRVAAQVCVQDGSRHLVLSVADTGPGIPAAQRDLLTTPYLRLSGTDDIPGTGLGLTVVQKVVQAHGGRLEVSDNAGQGSVFSIWLPA